MRCVRKISCGLPESQLISHLDFQPSPMKLRCENNAGQSLVRGNERMREKVASFVMLKLLQIRIMVSH